MPADLQKIPDDDLKKCVQYLLSSSKIYSTDRVCIPHGPTMHNFYKPEFAQLEPLQYMEKQYTLRDVVYSLSILASQQQIHSHDWAAQTLALGHDLDLKQVADAEYQRGYEQGRSEFIQSQKTKQKTIVAQERRKALRLDID